jgi:hypothetical protein
MLQNFCVSTTYSMECKTAWAILQCMAASKTCFDSGYVLEVFSMLVFDLFFTSNFSLKHGTIRYVLSIITLASSFIESC